MKIFDNPLLHLLLRRQRYGLLTMRVTLLLGGMVLSLSLVGLMIFFEGFSRPPQKDETFWYIFLIVPTLFYLMSILVALFSTSHATLFTSRYMSHREEFELLRLTHLSDWAITGALFATMLHRLRVVLVAQAVVGFCLALAFARIQMWQDINDYGYATITPPQQLGATAFMRVWLINLALYTALWGVNLIGISTGIFLGLWWRNPLAVLLTSISIIGGFTICCCCAAYGGFNAFASTVFFRDDQAFALFYSCGLCLIPVAIAGVATFILARYALEYAT